MKKNKVNIIEIIDYVLPIIEKQRRIKIPQFTRMPQWFDGIQKTAPRTLRQK